MFNVGDKVILQSHGLATIRTIEADLMGDITVGFYLLETAATGAKILIPIEDCLRHGIRKLSSRKEIIEVYRHLSKPSRARRLPWSRRFRYLSDKLRSSNILDIADVLRVLASIGKKNKLSFGEEKMLDKALNMLSYEICEVLNRDRDDVKHELLSKLGIFQRIGTV